MTLISWYLKKRKERRFLEALRETHGERRNQENLINVLDHGEAAASIWAEFYNGETHIRISFSRRIKKKNGKDVFLRSLRPEDLPDVCEVALKAIAYVNSFPR